jgi:hypothetical protein
MTDALRLFLNFRSAIYIFTRISIDIIRAKWYLVFNGGVG